MSNPGRSSPNAAAGPAATSLADITVELRNNIEVIEKLRLRRREIKALLGREGIFEEDEAPLADELAQVCRAITKLETKRKALYIALQTTT